MSGIVQGLLASFSSAAAVVTDAYFYLVTLLLNTTTTNGAQNNTFLDSSSNNFTITRNGNTTQGTFTPFSQTGWSNFCATQGTDYLNLGSNANFSFGTGIYTIEFFVYRTANGSTDSVFASIEASGTGWYVSTNLNAGVALNLRGTGAVVSTNSYQIPLNTWTHVVITRASTSASQTRIFINGVLAVAGTDATNWSATGALYLMNTGVAGYNAAGYLSNVRLIKGSIPTSYQTSSTTAGTSVFTSPTTALTTSSQGATSGNVSLLTCQDNRFIDNSATAATITPTGTPSVQAFSPFAPTAAYSTTTVGGSGYFDGTGDYLTVADSSLLEPGSGTFTAECWIYPTALPPTYGAAVLAKSATTSYGPFLIIIDPTTRYIYAYCSTTASSWDIGLTSTVLASLNTWYHVALVRSGSSFALFINGTRAATATSSGTLVNNTDSFIVGYANYTSTFFTGYISSVRYVVGTAVYSPASTTYTIPTAPANPSGSTLCINYTNAGIYDAAAKNDLETVGNAQVSTTQAKFGTTSMYFDGTGDNLVIPSNPNVWLGNGAFSIEMWLYPNNASSEQMLLCGNDTGSLFLGMNIDGANRIALGRKAVAVDNFVSYTYSTGAWIYLAVTRDSSNNVKFFVNGSQVGSTGTNSNSFTNSVMNIGFEPTQKYLNGYIDDLRITKGFARTITASPTAAFPIQ
jgi:hypothetical protein